MRYSIHSILRSTALLLLAGVFFLRCSEAPTASLDEEVGIQAPDASSDDLGAAAKKSPAHYRYFVGNFDGFEPNFCEIPDFCPDIAVASNGHTMEISGQGTLNVHPKSVSGEGTFVHRNAEGGIVAEGDWTATQLVSFVDYGPSPTDLSFPRNFRAGFANIRVHLMAGGAEFDAILRVQCQLTDVIPAQDEGSRLNVQGGLNFNKIIPRATLFVLQE